MPPPSLQSSSNKFVKHNGFLHTMSPLGLPATNALAERYVQTFKMGTKKLANSPMNIDDRSSLFLLPYRTTFNCTTEQSDANQFSRRHVKTGFLEALHQRDSMQDGSISRKTAMTAVLQTDHLAWTTLCTCIA